MPNEAVAMQPATVEAGSRRSLLQWGVGVMSACYAAALGYPIYRYLATPSIKAHSQGEVTRVSIAQKDIPAAGSATMFLFGSRPAMLIHHGDGHYTAFDAVCSHLGCTVHFDAASSRIACPCHGGMYDINTGAVLGGPPPKPLTAFHVEVTDGNIVVSRA